MSAKSTELGRIQELFDVITLTKQQVASVGLTKESFINPKDDAEDLIAEGVMNGVLRITEEAGHIEENIAAQYGFDSAGAVVFAIGSLMSMAMWIGKSSGK